MHSQSFNNESGLFYFTEAGINPHVSRGNVRYYEYEAKSRALEGCCIHFLLTSKQKKLLAADDHVLVHVFAKSKSTHTLLRLPSRCGTSDNKRGKNEDLHCT